MWDQSPDSVPGSDSSSSSFIMGASRASRPDGYQLTSKPGGLEMPAEGWESFWGRVQAQRVCVPRARGGHVRVFRDPHRPRYLSLSPLWPSK